jgi:hypothetical protein
MEFDARGYGAMIAKSMANPAEKVPLARAKIFR